MTHTHFLRIKGLSQKSTKSKSLSQIMLRVMGHNLREIVAEIGVREGSHINPAQVKNNIILNGRQTSGGVDADYKALMKDVVVSKWRKDTITAIELVFSLPVTSTINHHDYFTSSITWAKRFFTAPLVSAVIHLDEDAPHCHAILIPIVDGKLCGSQVMGNQNRVFAMQEDYHSTVGKPYGLARQVPQKRQSAAIRRDAVELAFNRLEPNSGIHRDILRVLVEAHLNNPVPLLKSMGLEMPTPKIKGTFVGIMTKPCKPEKVERYNKAKPIEVEASTPIEVEVKTDLEKVQPLCSVEVRFSEPVISTDSEPIQEAYQRESDSNQLSEYWNESTGEFIKPLVKASAKPIYKDEVKRYLKEINKPRKQPNKVMRC